MNKNSMNKDTEPILDFLVSSEHWRQEGILVDLKGDLKFLGCSPEVIEVLTGLQRRALPFAFLSYNPRAEGHSTKSLSRKLGEGWLQGRGMSHQAPIGMALDNIQQQRILHALDIDQPVINLYAKGVGSPMAAFLDALGPDTLELVQHEPAFRGYALGTDALPELPDGFMWGALGKAEAMQEYIKGLLVWKILGGKSLKYQQEEIHKLFIDGLVIPMLVVEQPELTKAVIQDEMNANEPDNFDPLVTMLSMAPAPTRVADQTELDAEAMGILTNEQLVIRLAENILELLRHGMMWHKSSWHPQNIYAQDLRPHNGAKKEPSSMMMADTGDIFFLLDYLTPEHQAELGEHELIIAMLAEALHNIRFMPIVDENEAPLAMTAAFYEHLLGRPLTKDEQKYCALPIESRIEADNYVDIAKGMAVQMLQIVYDRDRWRYARELRNKIAAKYELALKLDEVSDFQRRMDNWAR